MSIEIRRVKPDEMEGFRACLGYAFAFDPKEEFSERFDRTLEKDRSVVAVDRGEIVGTGGAWSLQMTVPGGVVPTGGTTVISVRPTHRRRGLLRSMMRFHIDEVRERGEPLAALWASESAIYGRFGFGIAAYLHDASIERRFAQFAEPSRAAGSVELIDADDAYPPLAAIYDRVAPTRPGMLARPESWWKDERLFDPEEWRGGATKYRYAIYREDGEALGYVQYRVKDTWEDFAKHTLRIRELVAVTDEAHEGLWRYLLDTDLAHDVKAWNLPVDDPLPWLLAYPRRLIRRQGDSVWVRIMDVSDALSARVYQTEGRVVFTVRDEFCPWNEGTFELVGGPDGAECKPTNAAPDITLPASALGAIYLGGNRLEPLVRAGRVEGDVAAIRMADQMFGWHRAPWTAEVF